MRRQGRKLHLAVDADGGEIAAPVLTDGNADDAAPAATLLGQAEGSIASVTAGGAHDGKPVCRAAAARQRDPPPDGVIPPRASAVPRTDDLDPHQTSCDRHTRFMAEKGRVGWQRATGYGKRDHVETTIGRCKHLIGPRLRARTLPAQQGEAAIAVAVLNRMIWIAKPVSVRRA